MLTIKKIFYYFKERTKNFYEHDTNMSYPFILVAFFIGAILGMLTAYGAPTGISTVSHITNIILAFLLHMVVYSFFITIIPMILSLLRIPIPRVASMAVLYVGILVTILLEKASSGFNFSIIIGLLASLATTVISLIFYLIFQLNYKKVITICMVGLLFIMASLQIGWQPFATTSSELDSDSPASFGEYETNFLTYGSGTDRHRTEFSEDITIQTDSLDASHFITKWSDKRRDFWEFGPENFPMNGRVWMPEGDGPFPVVLMVHGNHSMEHLSTAGYDYLGELLASRGFFFVSVDEDFVNYSNITGQPNDNYELRAWLLLQHLVALQEMNNDSDHLFHQKLDMNNVALGGHSRGGQAAAMAADYFSFFEEEEELIHDLATIDIQGVIAVSPTDRLIDNEAAQLYDTSYLTLHGSHDTDVYSFRGDYQFYRTSLDAYSNHIRSTVYIENANHVHFNEDWGHVDLSYPRGFFLNQLDLLPANEQQEIAKVYISAFLEHVLHDNREYDSLFKQDEETMDWLPDTEIITKFRPSTYIPIQTYAELPRVETYFDSYDALDIYQPIKRSGKNYTNPSVRLDFTDDALHKIDLLPEDLQNRSNKKAEKLVLTIANDSPDQDVAMDIQLLADGEEIQSWEKDLSPVIEVDATILGLFDEVFRDGKYDQKWEPIFENIEVPLDSISLNGDEHLELYIEFKGENPTILLEEIGVY